MRLANHKPFSKRWNLKFKILSHRCETQTLAHNIQPQSSRCTRNMLYLYILYPVYPVITAHNSPDQPAWSFKPNQTKPTHILDSFIRTVRPETIPMITKLNLSGQSISAFQSATLHWEQQILDLKTLSIQTLIFNICSTQHSWNKGSVPQPHWCSCSCAGPNSKHLQHTQHVQPVQASYIPLQNI